VIHEVEERLNNFTRIARERGYKLTPQRLAVFKTIVLRKDHPRADDIYQQVKKKYPMISLATVYKTLDVLKDIGLVSELGYREEGCRYDGNVSLHANMVCLKCKNINDINIDSLSKIEGLVAAKSGHTIIGSRIEFYGYCSECEGCEDVKNDL
jgi:Fur family peroxide stress response transcriptional regulator